ncbi:MAG TPA: hypothetical protein VFW79_09180 [Cellulomonas sp.]|uniref:hypothetical protein n=1 Tax=Cellulomonas sp. TaxID=40001 RepID=UPI002E302A9C|nr:hypothetical protein [Cellulomonas sp.]HEX5332805.1 hypothetical protein [Cellulomonas sp.]
MLFELVGMRDGGALSALVPLPDLTPEPAPYSTSPVAAAALVVVCVSMVAFVVVILRYIGSADDRRKMPWRAIGWTLGVAGVSVAVAALLMTSGQRDAREARLEYAGHEVDAWHAVASALEEAYGVRFASSLPLIPTENGDFMTDELDLPDGSVAECFVGAEDGFYSVLCGGDTAATSTALSLSYVAGAGQS